MNIQNLSLTDIRPYARNPRKNDEAVKNVAASIREFGFLVPFGVAFMLPVPCICHLK